MKPSRRLAALGVAGALAAGVLLWRCHDERGGAKPSAQRPGSAQRATRTVAKTASISGVVTDENRQPLANALVCVDAYSETLQSALIREPRCTRTDARGGYTVRELYAAEYEVAAAMKPYRPAHAKSFLLGDGEHRSGVDIQLTGRGVEVTGIVVDVTGGPIAQALVRQWTDPPVETDAQGKFTLWARPGNIELFASADGYAQSSVTAEAPGHYEILLTPESSISGTVVDARTGKPVANVTVEAGSYRDVASTDVTDDDGRFRLAHLEASRYAITARGDHGYGLSRGSVLVGLAQHVDGVVVELYPAFRVSGRVLQPDGKPCLEAQLSLARDDHELEAHRDPDGTLRVDGVLPGTYRVATACPGFAARAHNAPVVVVDRDIANLTWPVEVAGEISGKITTRAGAPIEGAQITATTSAGPIDEWTDGDGLYQLRGILPGKVQLDIFTAEGVPREDGYQLELGAGQKMKRDFVLDPPGRIRGVVTDTEGARLPGIPLNVMRQSGDSLIGAAFAYTDDKGELEAIGLIPGSYVVEHSTNAFGFGRAPVAVARTEVRGGMTATVQLTVPRHNGTIKGRVVDAAGKPVTDAFVGAVAEAGQGELAATLVRYDPFTRRVVTDQDGAFVLTNIAPGTHTVHAARKGGGEAFAKNVVVGATTLLRIAPTATIEGRVTVDGGPPPDELAITVRTAGMSRHEVFFRTAGRFAIGDLPPEDYRVVADIGSAEKDLAIKLAEGEHKRDIVIDFAGAVVLSGRFVDRNGKPIAKVRVMASTAAQRGLHEGESAADGRWTIADAPRGEVELMVFDAERDFVVGDRKFLVNGKGPVDLGDLVLSPSQ